ncbi:hypothetical protein BaRGS_00022478 [Batillaria attramentaria]|uniref:Uncharacterized protein n=1 Tax=Batillaria attramentaria TaxID=370345 RepID=A0ABD0KGD1_9CAEN
MAEDELKSPSRTSIQVKLPSASQRSAGSRSRGTHSPDSHLSSELKGSVFAQSRAQSFPAPTPTSSRTGEGSPPRSLRHGAVNEQELIRQAAASIIERAWENSLTLEILRKVCPKEADFFRDSKCLQIRVRFRFGGEEFPPLIFFKAAEDSLRLMGNRHFYDQMLQDTIRHQQTAISDEVDVTTLKDYMQYLSNLDETPAYLGGRENYWRKLTLDDLPRQTIFYDVVDFAYNQRLTPRLKHEIPLLMSRPVTQEVQVRHIQAISKMRTPTMPYVPAPTPVKSKMSGGRSQLSSRRSRQREMGGPIPDMASRDDYDYFDKYGITGEDDEEMDGEFDTEASRLYEWTQDLNLNDDFITTPHPLPAH